MLFKPAAIHLWYLFVICGLYLMLPFLRWLVQNARASVEGHRIQATIMGLWFTGIVLLPVIERGLLELGFWQEGLWDPVTGWNSLYDPGLILRYSGYLVVGYWLGQVRPGKRQFWGAAGLAVLVVGLTAGGTFWLTARNQGELDVFLYRRTMPNVLLLAVCSWQMIRFLVDQGKRTGRPHVLRLTTGVTRWLAQLSLGIYLLHPVCVDILMRGVFGVKLDALTVHPLLGIPLTTLVVFLISAGLTWLLKRIPGARWVLP
jgi:surface polysaccharide O-acyltransferase-like enzyme